MSKTSLDVVDLSFVAFLRATLGMMAGTEVINKEYVDFDFWTAWPRKFYNVRSYDATREAFEKGELDEIDIDVDIDGASNVCVPPPNPPSSSSTPPPPPPPPPPRGDQSNRGMKVTQIDIHNNSFLFYSYFYFF